MLNLGGLACTQTTLLVRLVMSSVALRMYKPWEYKNYPHIEYYCKKKKIFKSIS